MTVEQVMHAPRARDQQQRPGDGSPTARASCTGGHGTEPYEQNTQQSPALGRSRAWQCGHSKKNWQRSLGMT
jgi:hypothetical protein